MTVLEKQRIEEMRESGISYKIIASELGMNLGKVKMYCTRHGLGGKRGSESFDILKPGGCCEQCGKPVEQTAHRKHKRFCSSDCRMKWWATHRGELQQKTMHTFTCRNCGTVFSVYGETSRSFCSRKCYGEYRSSDKRC